MTTQGCVKRTSGGKGNLGKVNALISDAIIPPAPPRPLAPVFYPILKDQRHCENSEVALVVNPPRLGKVQTLVNDLKETVYASYWKKPVGKRSDPNPNNPMFPEGFDIEGTIYGKKRPIQPSVYEIIFPTDPLEKEYNPTKEPGVQTCRNYCRPAFNPDVRFGLKTKLDKRSKVLTDERVLEGKGYTTVMSTAQADMQEAFQPLLGSALTPHDNISQVPEGHRFGKIEPKAENNVKECLTTICDLNPGREFLLKCLAHINSVRKCLSKILAPSFFKTFYNILKYMDKEKTGWLPASDVLELALTKYIRVDMTYLGPLLEAWNAFDGKRIEYKTFCIVLNFKARLPDLPKVEVVSPECKDFRTTYGEMTKLGQDPGEHLMAGVTVDSQCNADKILLPMEADVYSCIAPSIMTAMNVNHRDMYAKREPHVIRRVFESAGEQFTEERFNEIWEKAKNYHSEGLVCYETFKRALNKFSENEQNEDPSKNLYLYLKL